VENVPYVENTQEKRREMKKIAVLILSLMFLVALIEIATIFACSWISNAGVRFVSSKIRFPLNICDFDVADQGEVVCFSNAHNRIQLFSKNGQFLKGWFVDNAGFTAGRVLIDSNDLIHFATPDDRHFTFDFDGNIIKDSYEKGIGDNITQLQNSKNNQRYDNCFYKIKSGIKGTGIVKTDSTGYESIVVSVPLYICFLGERVPWLVFFFLMPFILGLKELIQKRKKGKQVSSNNVSPKNTDD